MISPKPPVEYHPIIAAGTGGLPARVTGECLRPRYHRCVLLLTILGISAIIVNQPAAGTLFATVTATSRNAAGATLVEARIPCGSARCQMHTGDNLHGVLRRYPDGRIVLHWLSRIDAGGCLHVLSQPDLELRSSDRADYLSGRVAGPGEPLEIIGATIPLPPRPIAEAKRDDLGCAATAMRGSLP
jgi:hypothetical protein